MIRTSLTMIALTLLLAAGCTPRSQRAEIIPVMTPPPVEEAQVDPTANPGSLYDPGSSEHLFSDNRARRVGDIVVINIVEVSSGEHSANTDTERDASMDIRVNSFFNRKHIGLDPIGETGLLGLNGRTGADALVGTKTYNKMKGKASTDRDSSVKATVAARVVNILPGGLMQVEGAREVRVNEETQILVIRGLVRPRDIGPDNTVSSSHLANSSIEYYGKGILADKQKAGWVTRLLDNVWPF
jgi:flagellar L-ring protein FlgH